MPDQPNGTHGTDEDDWRNLKQADKKTRDAFYRRINEMEPEHE
jgi:hypothetical protein